ncbi:MAG TPA: TylF/MycF/NovP-related O-methyltransferase [Casimicrobiaceae bacterium]|nr:TylF/MycF/NovP-related O-methyltransferase [Casimicrobiaceae bacterium]
MLLKEVAKRGLARLGLEVFTSGSTYAQDGLYTLHNDHFRLDPAFRAAYRRGLQAATGVDPKFEWRVHVALWAATTALHTSGDFVECGVNAGFISSAIMHWLRWNEIDRRFFLVDTWAGPSLSQFDETEIAGGRREVAKEAIAAGAYVTDLGRLRRNFAEWPNAVIVQGMVPDILPSIRTDHAAFLHLDMNCAYPEQSALEYFWPRLSPGAVVLLDDYAYVGYERQASAIDGVARGFGASVLSLPTGQGVIVKS